MRASFYLFVFVYQISTIDRCQAKTVSGAFSSVVSQRGWGQYVTTFCFHGKYPMKERRGNNLFKIPALCQF